MPNKKISALTAAATPLAGTEVLPIVQSGATVKATVANIVGAGTSPGSFTTIAGNLTTLKVSAVNAQATALILQNTTADTAGGASVDFKSVDSVMSRIEAIDESQSNRGGMAFSTWGSTGFNQKMRLWGSGGLSLGSNTDPTAGSLSITGNLVQGTAAKGINFTANTPAAGMTSQLLNWYEEGSWTPVPTPVSGTITSYTSTGRYTRIGNQVTVALRLDITNVGTAGALLNISGLPFLSLSAASVSAGAFKEVGATGDDWTFYVTPSTTVLVGRTYNNSSAIATGYIFYGSCTYFTA